MYMYYKDIRTDVKHSYRSFIHSFRPFI